MVQGFESERGLIGGGGLGGTAGLFLEVAIGLEPEAEEAGAPSSGDTNGDLGCSFGTGGSKFSNCSYRKGGREVGTLPSRHDLRASIRCIPIANSGKVSLPR
jgi:hypothetical protein